MTKVNCNTIQFKIINRLPLTTEEKGHIETVTTAASHIKNIEETKEQLTYGDILWQLKCQ